MIKFTQLAALMPESLPEPDYFLKSIDNPFFMNVFRLLAAAAALVMLLGIRHYWKKFLKEEKNEDIEEEG